MKSSRKPTRIPAKPTVELTTTKPSKPLTPKDSKRATLTKASEPKAAAQDKLLAEALRRGENAREGMETVLKEYGAWLFGNVFNGDSAAAINERKNNPVWQSLLEKAGGSTLRLNERMLTVCLLAAAYDKHLNSDSWRLLDLGRKELLLRLETDEQLREGAEHAINAKTTWRMTRDYVANVLAEAGTPVEVRVSVPRTQKWLQTIHDRLSTEFQRKLVAGAKELDAKERKELQRSVATLHRELGELVARLSKAGG